MSWLFFKKKMFWKSLKNVGLVLIVLHRGWKFYHRTFDLPFNWFIFYLYNSRYFAGGSFAVWMLYKMHCEQNFTTVTMYRISSINSSMTILFALKCYIFNPIGECCVENAIRCDVMWWWQRRHFWRRHAENWIYMNISIT